MEDETLIGNFLSFIFYPIEEEKWDLFPHWIILGSISLDFSCGTQILVCIFVPF